MGINKVIIDCERMKYPYTGLFTYCKQLSEALIRNADNDIDLSFYVPASSNNFLGQEKEYLIQRSLHKFRNSYHTTPAIWHCTYQGSNYFSFNKKQKKVLTIHDLNFMHDEGKTKEKKEKLLKALQKKVDASDHLTAISQYSADFLVKYINIKNKPLTVIHNGCDVDLRITKPVRPSFIVKNRPFLFSLGTIARKKNFHVLPALLKGNDKYLILAGITQDEVYLKEIIDAAKLLDVEERIILPGAISEEEKFWLMQHMDAFVFPSLAEGFGIPVVEAMHFSAPVICSTSTSLPEIGGSSAYYFPGFDGEEMRKCLNEAVEDFTNKPFKKQEMNERAKSFSWDEAAKGYLNIYRSLLEQ